MKMNKLKQNTTQDFSSVMKGEVSKLPYLAPEVEIRMVELETDCLTTGSISGASANPSVTDWEDTSGNTNDIML